MASCCRTSSDGQEQDDSSSLRTVYVCDPFSGPVFERLVAAKRPILGPPAVRDLHSRGEPLLVKRSPMYCLTLHGCGIVLSGYRRKADLERLIRCRIHETLCPSGAAPTALLL